MLAPFFLNSAHIWYEQHIPSTYIELDTKSLYRRRDIFMEQKMRSGFEPVGNTEKKLGADYEQQRVVFSCFQG